MNAATYWQDRKLHHSYEYRWTIAAVVALACCIAALLMAVILSSTGEHFEFNSGMPPPEQSGEGLTSSATVEDNQMSGAASPEVGKDLVPADSGNRCSESSWPYFTVDCLWAADTPRRRRIVFRLKSPWCSGELRHQPFYICRARPK